MADLFAGLTVAAVMIPSAMAFAHIAGLPVITGLYASIFALIAYGLFGRVASMSIAPIASSALLTGIAVGRLGGADVEAAETAAGLSLMAAAAYAVVVLTGLDRLVDLISDVALRGFVSGLGVLIFSTQVDSMTGLPSDHPQNLWGDTVEVVTEWSAINWWAVGLSAITIAIVVGLPRFVQVVPAALVAVIVGIAAGGALDLGSRGVATVGQLPSGLPLPDLAFGGFAIGVVPVLFAIVVIGLIEMDVVGRLDPHGAFSTRRETAALAGTSAIVGLFHGMPVAGGPMRAVVARDAGARSVATPVVTGLAVGALVVLGGDWLARLPVAVIAGVVAVASVGLMRPSALIDLWRHERAAALIASTVFVATIVNVEAGVAALIGCSVLDARRTRTTMTSGAADTRPRS